MTPSHADPASTKPLRITLNFTRAHQASVAFGVRFGRQGYIYHRTDDGAHKAILNWDGALIESLGTHPDGRGDVATELCRGVSDGQRVGLGFCDRRDAIVRGRSK